MIMSTPFKLFKHHLKELHKFFHTLSKLTIQHYSHRNVIHFRSTRPVVTSSSGKMRKTDVFSFENYDIIGFDLDNTLMRYNLEEMTHLEYSNIANFLVKRRGYTRDLFKSVSDDTDFLQKGLIFDMDRGNILKIAPDGCILRASHGSRFLSEKEIVDEYGPEKCWHVTTQFVNDPLSTWNGPLSEKMRALLDYFDMPSSLAFARAVDAIDFSNLGRPKKYQVYSDILDALIEMFKRESFADGSSEYFEALKSNPNQYVMKTDPRIIDWLKELKKTKAIYLLTGSNIDFANLTASTALGHNWQELFDVVVSFARKPAFFTERRPFYALEGFKETSQIKSCDLKLGETYCQGNWTDLNLLLTKKFQVSNPRSLYIGDNLIQDIYTPCKYVGVDTICVAEEIAAEVKGSGYEFTKVLNSNSWDSYFFVDDRITLWTGILKKYAKMSVPSLEHFCDKPLNHQYRTKPLGFYPLLPSRLKV